MRGFYEVHAAKIQKTPGCWVWIGCINPKGYGAAKLGRKKVGAHRLAYEATHGQNSASGLVVRHDCDNPACVRPDHLSIGTQADNIRDAVERKRVQLGENRPNARLTEDAVREIRSSYRPRHRLFGQCAFARRFGVTQSVIFRALNKASWKHVDV